jgi:hypothetical protein
VQGGASGQPFIIKSDLRSRNPFTSNKPFECSKMAGYLGNPRNAAKLEKPRFCIY